MSDTIFVEINNKFCLNLKINTTYTIEPIFEVNECLCLNPPYQFYLLQEKADPQQIIDNKFNISIFPSFIMTTLIDNFNNNKELAKHNIIIEFSPDPNPISKNKTDF